MYYLKTIGLPLLLLLALAFLLLKKKKSTIFIVIGLIAWLIAAYFVYGLMLSTFFTYEKTYVFDQKKWQEDKANRWRMGSDLIESKLLEHKDSNQVLLLLGQPDTRIDTQQQWIYQTGEGGGGLGFLLHYLDITYKEGKVTKANTREIKD